MNSNVNVWFLHHSCFAIEIKDYLLLFDYYKDEPVPPDPISPEYSWDTLWPQAFKTKKVRVFSSHKHGDHFNPVILSWQDHFDDIHYFFSRDISKKYVTDKVTVIKAHEELQWGELKVKALRSTDLGVAFLLGLEGLKLYHAGDLHWWHWNEEDEAWNKNMAARFKKEISLLKGISLDLAFVPLDPRQEDAAFLGIEYFLNQVEVKTVFPMHFWENYSIMDELKVRAKANPLLEKVLPIDARGRHFAL